MPDETEGMSIEEAKAAAAAKAAAEAETADYRNYPRSPAPGTGPVPYEPTEPLTKSEEALPDPTPPEFPIGTPPENLTDMTGFKESAEASAALVTPPHCPTCRGRGFIGGAVCPDCDGTGIGPEVDPEPPDPNV